MRNLFISILFISTTLIVKAQVLDVSKLQTLIGLKGVVVEDSLQLYGYDLKHGWSKKKDSLSSPRYIEVYYQKDDKSADHLNISIDKDSFIVKKIFCGFLYKNEYLNDSSQLNKYGYIHYGNAIGNEEVRFDEFIKGSIHIIITTLHDLNEYIYEISAGYDALARF